jgi:hypothetical protein
VPHYGKLSAGVLGARGDELLDSQVDEVGFDLSFSHFFWVAFLVEENVFPDPGQVSPFSGAAVMFQSQGVPDLIEQFFWFFVHRFLPGDE